MPQHFKAPSRIKAEGMPPKEIYEYIGRVNSETDEVSVARMKSPEGWSEPGQRPEFDEFTVVLAGKLDVRVEDGSTITVDTGESIAVKAGEWVQYSTPHPQGADYIAVCVPAFSPEKVNRDEE